MQQKVIVVNDAVAVNDAIINDAVVQLLSSVQLFAP